jgi:hypothetical protein
MVCQQYYKKTKLICGFTKDLLVILKHFIQRVYSEKKKELYIKGIRNNIQNDSPIIGKYGVRNEGSGDMYTKGGNMLHTIRTVINDDEKFRQILRGLGKDFYHQTVTTKQIEDYISSKSGINFSKVLTNILEQPKFLL